MSARCFVAGGTGVLGRAVVPRLVGAGHSVSVLSRGPDREAATRELGGTPVRASLFDPASLVDAIAGHEILINLATHIPPLKSAARAEAWTENDRIRTEGVANLTEAARETNVDRYIQESIVFPYEDAGDEWIDEESPRTTNGPGGAIAEAERNTELLGREVRKTVILRFAQLYSPDSSHTVSHAALCRRGINPLIGPPDGFVPIVGIGSASRAVLAGIGLPSGIYNVVDDDPVTRLEAGNTVAAAIGRRRLHAIPPGLITLLNPSSDVLLRSQRVSNAKLRRLGGWEPDYSGAEGFAKTMREILT